MKSNRKQILINPQFQLRFASFITVLMFGITMILPMLLMQVLENAKGYSLLMNNPPAQLALRDAKKELLLFTVGFELVIIICCFLFALLHSHRIAGPLYKLKTAMTSLRQGLLERQILFRKKDNFMELATEFNEMSNAITARRRKDFEYIHSVIPKLDRLQNSLAGEQRETATEVLNVLQELVRESNEEK